jgi:hypothetical protein
MKTCTFKGRRESIRGEFNDVDCEEPLIKPVICWEAWGVTIYTQVAAFYSRADQQFRLYKLLGNKIQEKLRQTGLLKSDKEGMEISVANLSFTYHS